MPTATYSFVSAKSLSGLLLANWRGTTHRGGVEHHGTRFDR
jgi:hypothetical protein